MKLHIPLKLLAALLACVMHTSFATGVVTIPDNATDEQLAAAKAELATPTLTGLYTQDPETYTTESAYQLVEVTGDVDTSSFTITKYLKTESNELTPVSYNVEVDEVFGDGTGDTASYYKWSEDTNGNRTLVSTTDANEADLVYIYTYDLDNTRTSRLSTSSGWTDGDDINVSFIGCYVYSESSAVYGGAIYNSATIGDIKGDFIANYASGGSFAYGGAIYNNYGTIGDITGNFIANYAYSASSLAEGGAIYNLGTIGDITGDFIGNYAYSYSSSTYGGAIYNYKRKIETITGDFIANYAYADTYSLKAYGGAICNGSGKIETITGDFIANYAYSYFYSYGGAIYNEGEIGSITGDFIANYAYSEEFQTYGGAIYNTGTITSITGDFIGNYAIFGGAIYNSYGTITLLAQDDDILFNDNTAYLGEAIYNTSTIYLNAYEGYEITFNDTIYNTGSSANIIIGELNSEEYSGTIVLNAAFTGDSFATLTLASGTLAFGQYTDSDGVTSYGNISELLTGNFTETQLVITGGEISTMDGNIRETTLGYLTLTANETCWSFDIDLTSGTADTLSATSVSGDGLLLIDGINLVGSTTEESITLTLTTDESLMSSISTDLSNTYFLINNVETSNFSALSYDSTTGQLTLSVGEAMTLNEMVALDESVKQYSISADLEITESLGVLAGTSMSIFGNGNDITADGSAIAGITINDSTQTLTISDVALWSGFSVNAVTNNAGTLSIAAASSDSTWDDSIVNNATMNVSAAAGKTVTFDAAVTGTGTLTLNDANNSGSIVFNDVLTQDEIIINAGSVSVNAAVTGDINLLGGSLDMNDLALSNAIEVSGAASIANGSAYAGQLTLTSGSLAGDLNLSQDLLANEGTVSATLSGTAGVIVNGTVTLSGANSYTGETVLESGTLTLANISAAGTSDITLEAGTLKLSSFAVANDIEVVGDASISDASAYAGQLTLTSGSLAGALNLSQDLIANSGTVSATLSGTAGVIVNGTVMLSAANSYTGDTVLESGTLTLANVSAAGASDIMLEAGTLNLSGLAAANDIEVNGAATITNGSAYAGQVTLSSGSLAGSVNLSQDLIANSGTVSATLSGTAGVLVNGEVTLSGANSYSGDTVLESGTLTLANVSAAGTSEITLEAGTLNLSSLTVANDIEVTGTTSISNGSAYAGQLTLTSGSLAGSVNLNQDLIANSGTVSAALSGTAGVVVNGTVTLSGANSYTGDTIIESGTLTLANVKAAGTSDITLEAGTLNLSSLAVANDIEVTGTTSISNGSAYAGQLTLTSGSLAGNVNLSQDLLANSGTVSATLSGTAGVVVNGTVTLSGANSYTGDTVLESGTLTLDNVSAAGMGDITLEAGTLNLSNLAIANDIEVIGDTTLSNASAYTGQLTLTSGSLAGSVNLSQDLIASSGTITASLSGSSGLQKIGTGTVTLTGDASYTGTTSVLAGTLIVEVATASNSFDVSKGASLQLDGSTIDLDTSDIQGSLTLNNSDLLISSTDYSMDSLIIGTGNELIIDDLSSFATGSYTLISTTSGVTGNLYDLLLDISGTSALYSYELSVVDSSLVLSVVENTDIITWNGSNANWSTQDVWLNLDGEPCTYEDGMIVAFNGGVVTLNDTVEPAAIIVSGADDTTITGTGSITGATSLDKSGEGTLTLNTENSYTGGTTLTEGSLVLGNVSAAGTGLITLTGGELDLSSLAIANDIEVSGDTSIADGSAYAGQISLSSGSLAGSVNLSQDLLASSGTVTATLSGSSGVVVNGTVTLSGTNSYTGDTVLESGSLTLANVSAAGSSDITLEAGTLNLSNLAIVNDIEITGTTTITNGSAYAGQLTLTSGSLAGTVNLSQDLLASTGLVSAQLSGSAGVVVDGVVTLSGTNSYTGDTVIESGTLTLTNASAAGTGDITLKAGTLDLSSMALANDITVTADASLTQASAFVGSLSIGEGATLTVTNGDLTLDSSFNNAGTLDASAVDLSFTGDLNVGGVILASDIVMSGDNSFASITATGDINNAGNLTLTAESSMNSLSGGGSLVANADVQITGNTSTSLTQLSGTGSLTVAGDLSLSTQSAINTLSVGGNLSLAAGSTVTNTLSLDGSLSITGSLDANSPALSVGSLSVDGNLNIVMDYQSILDLNLGVNDVYELIAVTNDYTGTVTLNGSTSYEITDGYNIAIGVVDGSIQVFIQTTNNFWISEDGTWESGVSSDWTQGSPSYNVDAMFYGQGTSEVSLVGEQSVGNTIINSDSQDYTFNGDKLSTVTLQIIEGGLTINNEVEVSSTAIVSEGASLTINKDGSLTVLGALSADNQSIANNGSLSFGQGSFIGEITGTGTITATGDATIGSIAADSNLSITGADTELTLKSNTSLSSLINEGSLNLTGYTLTMDATTTTGGSITATQMTLSNGGCFNALITDRLSLGSLSTSSYVLSVDSISSISGGLIVLDMSSLSSSTTCDIYQLIDSADTSLSWDSFTLSDATATAINELIINEGKTISYLTENGKLSLSIADAPDSSEEFVWDVSSSIASSTDGSTLTPIMVGGKLSSYDALDQVTQVNVSTSVELDLTSITPSDDESLLISNMSGFADATLSIVGDDADEDSVTLYNSTKTVALNAVVAEDVTVIVDNTGSATALSFGALELDSANLTVLDGASLTVDSIDSSALSVIEGEVTIVGDESSKLLGSYVDATLDFQTSASALIYVANAEELSLKGTGANIQLISSSGNAINSFNLTDSTLTLGSYTTAESFSISSASSMSGGTLSITISDSMIGSSATPALISGAALSLSGTTLSVSSTGSTMDISSFTSSTGIALFTLTDDASSSSSNVTVELTSGSISKYFTNATYVNGVLYADLNTNSYGSLAKTNNGAAGLSMMGIALIELNPQMDENSEKYPDLASALDGLDTYKAAGNSDAADKLGAAIAGASITSLGSAAQADLSRQLRSIRSRSKNVGLANATILESKANAWISLEGGYSSLSTDGTASGHDLSSVGASLGAEVNVADAWRIGAAITLVKGDLSSDAPDYGEADLTTYYASFYANKNTERWSHNFVATLGKIDASLERTVVTNEQGDYYKTKGDTDGMSFALSYELGYNIDLNEDATSTLQPLVSLSYINSSISGYTEEGSDAALTVGDQKNNYVTLGIGVQYDTIIGASIYNRESLLTTRMVVNIDAGDRMVEADVKLASSNGSTYTIKGAEPGAIGLEFGLGLDVPVSESSSLFIDAACEFRSKMTDISAGIGYRLSF